MDGQKRVCVFCGSSSGNNPSFAAKANKLGKRLASNNIGLVYGGGSVGIMNAIANGVITRGGSVHGVIPEHLNDREHAHKHLTALHITDTMHERKAMMAELSNAFIALPGGFGTFEELLEAITWTQLGLHDKSVIIYNMDGYYEGLINFIDHATEEGFISPENRQLLKIGNTIDECLQHLPF